MILRFVPGAAAPERGAVLAELQRLEVPAEEIEGAVRLGAELDPEEALRLAAMAGVLSIEAAPTATATVRESILDWIAAATAVLGVLVLVAANVPASLGAPADPLRTPAAVSPSWPLLPVYAAEDLLPPWVPVSVVVATGAAVLLLWPVLGRRIAEGRPRLHTALGVALLAGFVALTVMGVRR